METREIVVLVVVALVVLAVIAAVLAAQKRKRERERLQSTFGPEYDRTVGSSGRRRDAERELAARAERRASFDIRPLPAADRQAFAARWTQTQADFVDRPAEAVTSADRLVSEVMHQRGYPVGDFEQQARDLSVDHAEVVQEYRAAHDISLLNDRQQATTEQLRQAMVHYRALFTELLGNDDVTQAAAPVYPTGTAEGSDRALPPHGLSDREVAYLDGTDNDVEQRAEARFQANHDGRYDERAYDDERRDATLTRSATDGGHADDPGYATDEDRRVREGGLLGSDREQPQVVHVRRERLEDDSSDRDLPPRG